MIYLDNNATTRVADEVVEAMRPYYFDYYGNPHSSHLLGRKAHDGLESARGEVAALVGADASEITFTSCGTESNALVLHGFGVNTPRRRLIVTSVEHPSIKLTAAHLAESRNVSVQTVGVDRDGRVDLEHLSSLLDDETALVAVMLAQNETGVIHDVRRIADLAHERGALVLVDAVQCAGKIPIDVNALGADFLSLSGHKLHAPKGIGALYVRRNLRLSPIWHGGGQESGLRSGTEAVPLAVGLGRASALALSHLESTRVREMRDAFEREVLDRCENVTINGAGVERLPNTSSISFEGLYGDEIVIALDESGVCASAGAACHSGLRKASAVMEAMSKPLHQALGTVRFSLSRYSTPAEMTQAAERVVEVATRLRAVTANA
jgi:cysteine desulfurase